MKIFFYLIFFPLLLVNQNLIAASKEFPLDTKSIIENTKWEWKKIHTQRGEHSIDSFGPIYAGTAYIDESSISELIIGQNVTRSYYNLINLQETIGTSNSIIFKTNINCNTKKYSNAYMQFFSEPFGKGSSAMNKEWKSNSPNIPWQKGRIVALSKHACKVKPAHITNMKDILDKLKKKN